MTVWFFPPEIWQSFREIFFFHIHCLRWRIIFKRSLILRFYNTDAPKEFDHLNDTTDACPYVAPGPYIEVLREFKVLVCYLFWIKCITFYLCFFVYCCPVKFRCTVFTCWLHTLSWFPLHSSSWTKCNWNNRLVLKLI